MTLKKSTIDKAKRIAVLIRIELTNTDKKRIKPSHIAPILKEDRLYFSVKTFRAFLRKVKEEGRLELIPELVYEDDPDNCWFFELK